MREVGEGFQKNLAGDVLVVFVRIELVQFQNRKVGLQIICIFLRLNADVSLQSRKIFRVVPIENRGTILLSQVRLPQF